MKIIDKQISNLFVTRATIEVGKTLGYLPGDLGDKFNPYIEALQENLAKCYDPVKVDELITNGKIKALPIQFIRGKTVDDVLIVEEAQNITKHEMLAILTRLGKTGKIIINGDLEQSDIKTGEANGLAYAIELSKKIEDIKWIKLKENHRSDLVGKILDYEYNK
jgi:phosphate starvation-inducible PhoH-like protein